MSNDDAALSELMVRPLKPVHVPVERACLHPLLRHAVIDEHGYVQWPTLTERQHQVAGESARLIRVDGRLVFSLPPRASTPTSFYSRIRLRMPSAPSTEACAICGARTCRSTSRPARAMRCSSPL